MAHNHSIVDVDNHFVIDPITRGITTESGKLVLTQHDHNSERFTFEIPRIIEGHDMSSCNCVQIHFENTSKDKKFVSKDFYTVTDLRVSSDNGAKIIFSWLISESATHLVGKLKFAVRFECASSDGSLEYAWGTRDFDDVRIVAGVYNTDTLVAEHSDFVTRMETIAKRMSNAVQSINGESPDENGNVDIRADWNENDSTASGYINNRPFYETVVVGDAVTAEETITCDNTTLPTVDMSVLIGEYPMYKVIFDSVEYICESLQHFHPQGGYPDCWYLGNAHLCWSDSTATDEPFCLTFAQTGPWSGMLNIYADDGDHTIQVFAAEVEYTKIDEQFIPDTIARIPDWNQHDNTATDYIKNRPFYECTDFGPGNAFTDEKTFTCETTGSYYVITTESTLTPKDGQRFYIMFDGETHQCHVETFDVPGATDGTQETGMGNKHIRCPDLEDNGLPFYLHCTYWGRYVFMVYSNPGTHTIQIFEDKHVLKQIDEKFIPDTIARKTDFVQSDWTITDETNAAYIKNKPFYDKIAKFSRVTDKITITGPRTIINTGIYGAISEYDLAANLNADFYCVVFDGSDYICKPVYGDRVNPGWYLGNLSKVSGAYDSTGEPFAICITQPGGDSFEGHFYCDEGTTHDVQVYLAQDLGAKTLDEKYIPDTIARKADIPEIPENHEQVQADWRQDDDAAASYIKNRTHYEKLTTSKDLRYNGGSITINSDGYAQIPFVMTMNQITEGIFRTGEDAYNVKEYDFVVGEPFTVDGNEVFVKIDIEKFNGTDYSVPKLCATSTNVLRGLPSYKAIRYITNREIKQLDAKYLPIATAATLGGIKAEPATEADTQPVRIGEDGMLYTKPGGGTEGNGENTAVAPLPLLADVTSMEALSIFEVTLSKRAVKRVVVQITISASEAVSAVCYGRLNGALWDGYIFGTAALAANAKKWIDLELMEGGLAKYTVSESSGNLWSLNTIKTAGAFEKISYVDSIGIQVNGSNTAPAGTRIQVWGE